MFESDNLLNKRNIAIVFKSNNNLFNDNKKKLCMVFKAIIFQIFYPTKKTIII